jgi:hypothetical protein
MVTKYKKSVVLTFLGLAVLSVILTLLVSVNYNLVDYLPKDAQSTNAIRIMAEEFGGEMPNARVMVTDVTVPQALEYKTKLAAVNGVTSVSWLDDVVGSDVLAATPVEFLDSSIRDAYYKDNSALFMITIESGKEESTVAAIREIIGDKNAVAGYSVNTATSQEMSTSEVRNAMLILVPVIIIILILATTSWMEPLLYLLSIGIAIVINMGTNAFIPEVSFITQTISPVLQLAVSLDYAIFLLHSFQSFRLEHEPQEAMRMAMKQALLSISASAATTVIGFMALMVMRFGIGSDLGINLVKGILLSFISVMVFLPAFTLISYKLIDKYKHRQLLPDLHKIGGWLLKIRIPFLLLAVIVVIPCFLAQANTEFLYGLGNITKASRAGDSAAMIEERFGEENTLALLVPKGEPGKETQLCDALNRLPHITSVVAYATAIGAELPPEYIPEKAVGQFYSEHYARVILYTNLEEEGEETFHTVKAIMDTAAQYYPTYYLAGQSATLYDMREVVSVDTGIVNLVAVIGIFLVLLISFRSLTIPVFLVFSIETAIWINLSFAYFAGNSLNFIGYLVISTVQLGATVDYAILLTNRYLQNRKEYAKKEAMKETLGGNLAAILISAAIMASAGFILAATSTNPIISELGMLLGRGTTFSFLMVVCVLPALLLIFDTVIRKTTLSHGFHMGHHKHE